MVDMALNASTSLPTAVADHNEDERWL